MWKRLHILSTGQVFLVSSLAAGVLALPTAVISASEWRPSILQDFFWPHSFTPYLTWSSGLLAVLTVFLLYYHLGRLGLLVSIGIAPVCWYGCGLVALFAFLPHDLWFGIAGYAGVWLLLYFLILKIHCKVARSLWIQESQRKLRLLSESVAIPMH